MLTAASDVWRRAREAGEVRGQGNATLSLSLPRSSAAGCSERISYSVELLYEAAVINCLYQPGRAEGGRGVAYPYVNQLTGLDWMSYLQFV